MMFRTLFVRAAALAVTSLFANSLGYAQAPLTTAFTYQGELAEAGIPVSGLYDIRFKLYDAATGGNQVGDTLCSNDLTVTNGRFITSLDFGAAFAGQQRFLEIEVRADSGLICSDTTGFTMLEPRQELTASPNATFAASAGSATTAASAVTATNALNLGGTPASGVATLSGNQTFTGLLNFSNPGNTFFGSGAGLTNLSGGSINAGTLARSSLSADVQSGVGTLVPDLALAGSVAAGDFPSNVTVSGSFAYVVDRFSDTLQVFNISNPGAPTLVGSVGTGDGPVSVAVSGSFAYVVSFTSGTLQIFNISNPATPTLAGSIAAGTGPLSVAVSGSFAYVSNSISNTLQIFNISNAAAPTLAGSVATGPGPVSVAVSGSFAYVTTSSSSPFRFRLEVYDISNPAAPTLAGSVATGPTPVSVAVSGSFAYVVNQIASTLEVFNISNPAAITRAGSILTGTTPQSVAVSGSFAYVVNVSSSTLQVFNISNPAAPTLAGSIGTGISPFSVAVSGSYAYVGSIGSNTLQVFKTFGVGFSVPLASSSLACVNGSGLTGVNATQFNGQPASFYTNASNITSGVLAAAQIPNLDASKITTGTLSASRIPDLDASKITTGALNAAQIPTLDASMITTGSLNAALIPNLDASKITTGSLASTVLPSGGNWSISSNLNIDSGTLVVDAINSRVGVGTSSLASRFHVFDSSPLVALVDSSSTIGTWFSLNNTTASTTWKLISTGTGNGEGVGKLLIGYGPLGGNTPVMTFTDTSGGRVGIRTSAPDQQLTVNGNASKSGGGSWATFSDARLKHDVAPLGGTLDKLLQLRGVSFYYNDPASINEIGGQRIGMIAQEVERVFPDWVEVTPRGYKSLTFRGFEALTVEALRDLRAEKDAEIEKLKAEKDAEIKALHDRLERLEKSLEALTAER